MTTTCHFEELKLVTEFKRKRCIHTITDSEATIRYETWIRTKTLGKGSEGTVYKETCLERSGVRAVKQIQRSPTGANRNEIAILAQLRSYPEHFVQLTGWFEDKNHIYLAMEYLPVNLGTLLKNRTLSELDIKKVTKQILVGLEIMHKMNICHRDLKPSNILVAQSKPVLIKIADFGISKYFDSTECRTIVGTNSFMAPEVWGFGDQETSVYTTAVDIWSLGCLLYFMITKALPFTETEKLERFVDGRIPFPPLATHARTIPRLAMELIVSMLRPSPQDRPPASKAQGHSWLSFNEPPRDLGQPTSEDPDPASTEPKLAPLDTLSSGTKHQLSDLEVMGTLPLLDTRPKKQNRAAALGRGRESIQYLLVAAAASGDCKTLIEALGKGAKSMENPSESGYPPIYIAAKNGHLPVIKLLLTNGAHLGVDGKHEVSALHGAAEAGNLQIVQYLLDNGADISAVEKEGRMAHHIAARFGATEALQLLVERGADISARETSGYQCTALMYAARYGHLNAVRYLLDRGADISAVEKDGRMAHHIAAQFGATEVLQLLVERGAGISAREESGDQWTALMYAARYGHVNAARYLLERGASISVAQAGKTAMSLAAEEGHIEVVVLLSNWDETDTSITFTELDNPRLSTEDSTQATSEDESMTSLDSRASPSESLFSTHLSHGLPLLSDLYLNSDTIWE
ncbi:kinase-like domain-containing protein [Morchella snyderi]|nr:kinase-like domain-containing protein [Morchella snyderi]